MKKVISRRIINSLINRTSYKSADPNDFIIYSEIKIKRPGKNFIALEDNHMGLGMNSLYTNVRVALVRI